MMHSSICANSTPARRTASRTTRAPNCGAEKDWSDPWNLPTGVRTAETITTSLMAYAPEAWDEIDSYALDAFGRPQLAYFFVREDA